MDAWESFFREKSRQRASIGVRPIVGLSLAGLAFLLFVTLVVRLTGL